MKLLAQLCLILAISLHAWAKTNPPVQLLKPPGVQSLSTNSNSKSSLNSTNLSSLRRKAYNLYEDKKFAEAAKLCVQILAQNTNDSDATWQLACCYYYQQEFEDAADTYAKFVKLRPDDAIGHRWLGATLWQLKEFPEAERELTKALDLKPDDADALQELAYCYDSQDEYLKAAKTYDAAIRAGGMTVYRCSAGGASYIKAKQYTRGIALLKSALKLDPSDMESSDWLGVAYYHTGDYSQAATTFKEVLTRNPEDYYAQDWLAHTYLKQTNFTLAAEAFAKAAAIRTNGTSAAVYQAYALLHAERATNAVAILEPIVAKHPSNKFAKRTLLSAYLATRNYEKATALYSTSFTIGAVFLLIVYLGGSVGLIYKSFKPSAAEYPHIFFAITWLAFFLEGQAAMLMLTGVFAANKLVFGLALAPLPIIVAVVAAFPRQPWGQPFTKPTYIRGRQIAMAIGGWVATAMLIGIYVQTLKSITHVEPEPHNIRLATELMREHPAVAGLVVVILAPITEEALFRGLLFGALRKWFSATSTILITAAVFAAFHLDLKFFIPMFLLGVLLGWARHTANSIWFGVGIHIFQNALAFTALCLK